MKKEKPHTYSSLRNKRTGPNKRTGWNFDKNQISLQGGILIKILEYRVKTGNFINDKNGILFILNAVGKREKSFPTEKEK